jgi:uroporphyrinogen-III synthase/uroporphyrinogen III methyltransferase/synthase
VSEQPLEGRRVLVTRAAGQAGKLSDGLRVLGAEPVEVPVLEIRPPASFGPLDAALRQLDSYNWLILTSANVVRVLHERAAALGISLSRYASLHVAAVGSATAKAAIDGGIKVDFIPESYVAGSLVEGLLGKVAGQRILLARAAVARDVIPDAMRAAGAQVDVVDAYQNVMPEAAPEQLRQALARGIAAATFTSSSSANHLAEAVDKAGLPWPLPGIPAISIGPITSQTLRELGWEPAAEANPSDMSGLIAAVKNFFESLPR